jgi:ABC-type sugar transport system ATPase subunit
VGTPQRLYERPATSFVARALGPANLIAGRVREASNGTVVVDTASGALRIPAPELPLGAGAEVLVVARPEHVRVERDGPDAVVSAAFARDVVELVVQSRTATVRARVAGDAAPEPGAAVTVAFDEPRLSLVPADADAR